MSSAPTGIRVDLHGLVANSSSCTTGALKALNRGAPTEEEAHDRTQRWEAVLNALTDYRTSVDQTEDRESG